MVVAACSAIHISARLRPTYDVIWAELKKANVNNRWKSDKGAKAQPYKWVFPRALCHEGSNDQRRRP